MHSAPRLRPHRDETRSPMMQRCSSQAQLGAIGRPFPIQRRALLKSLLALIAVSSKVGCRSSATKHLRGETVEAACAMCVYAMEGVRGCIWAVRIDGKPYLAEGTLPKHHDAHAPDGMCNVKRQAVVSGELVHQKFVAQSFDLKPATHIPANPRFTPAHRH